MISFLNYYLLLAEGQQEAQGDPNFLPRMLFLGSVMAFLFYFMLWRPQKQKEKELRGSIEKIKENDRVVTIGGIHGIVTNVQREAQRVTIRVDESTGTKIRFNISAISRVLTAEEQDGSTPAAKSAST